MVNLLGKSIAESRALCIPTAAYGHPFHPFVGVASSSGGALRTPRCANWVGNHSACWSFQHCRASREKQLGPPGPTRPTFCSLVAATHCSWRTGCASRGSRSSCRASRHGLCGVSAGSMALTPMHPGRTSWFWKPPTGGDQGLGIVDFSIFPHVDHPDLSENTMTAAEKVGGRACQIRVTRSTMTPRSVVDGAVDLVTEGHWRHFPH